MQARILSHKKSLMREARWVAVHLLAFMKSNRLSFHLTALPNHANSACRRRQRTGRRPDPLLAAVGLCDRLRQKRPGSRFGVINAGFRPADPGLGPAENAGTGGAASPARAQFAP